MEWEQSKENIQPLKKGRSVKGLGGFRDKLSIDQSEKDYFQKLEAARTISTQDLLNIYIEFYSWIRRTCNDNEKGKILLENCVKEIGTKEELKNDPKLVKLWLEYADVVQDPMEVFNFMDANDIGSKVALYWIAWAFYYEKSGNFKAADRVFLKGIRQLAQPKDLLNRRYHQFQRRMTRHFLNNDIHNDEKLEENRKFDALSSNNNPIDKAIPSSSNSAGSLGFTIFSDDSALEKNNPPTATGSAAPNFWNTISSEQERKKENEMLKTKWSQQALPLPAKISNPTLQSAPLSIPFTIFSDDGNAGAGLQNSLQDSAPPTQPALGIRTTSQSKENPKANHSEPSIYLNENNGEEKRKEAPKPVAKPSFFLKDEDETINTKLALADLEDMFACTEFDDQVKW